MVEKIEVTFIDKTFPMNNKTKITILFFTLILIAITAVFFRWRGSNTPNDIPEPVLVITSPEILAEPTPVSPAATLVEEKEEIPISPMDIEALRARNYPASALTIEEALGPGSNYQRFIASYISEGSRIYGLLTTPNEQRPEGGYPAILFLHGFIPPETYVTTADYVASQDGLARSGFVTFKPDLRGHGRSEGTASGARGC